MSMRNTTDLLEWAWSIISNAGGGDWDKESKEWQEAATKWRDAYLPKQGKTMSEPELREIAEKWAVICEKGMQVREAIRCACEEACKLGHDKRTEMAIQQALDERAAPTD